MITLQFLQEKIFPLVQPEPLQPNENVGNIQEIYYRCAYQCATNNPSEFLTNQDFHSFDDTKLILLGTIALEKTFNIKTVTHKKTESVFEDSLEETQKKFKIKTMTHKKRGSIFEHSLDETKKTIYSPEHFCNFATSCPDEKMREAFARKYIKSFGEETYNLVKKYFNVTTIHS